MAAPFHQHVANFGPSFPISVDYEDIVHPGPMILNAPPSAGPALRIPYRAANVREFNALQAAQCSDAARSLSIRGRQGAGKMGPKRVNQIALRSASRISITSARSCSIAATSVFAAEASRRGRAPS